MKKVKVGLLGFGVIGKGVYTLIDEHQDELAFKVDHEVIIDKILVNSLDKERFIGEKQLENTLFTDTIDVIVEDPDISMIIEVVGGEDEAFTYIKQALEHGKSVITANKDVVAKYGNMLHRLAEEHGCDFFYEASVGGGIPIIRGLVDGLASDKIETISGIINGTTNYILTKMDTEGLSYESALEEATRLGFAEPDPTNDVDGYDAARKMVILASLGFSMPIRLDDVKIKGIRHVTEDDINMARQMGYVLKLMGYAEIKEGKVEVSVEPTLLEQHHPLASVQNEYNAIFLTGEAVGQTMFYGPGAGAMPTATSIVSDVMNVIKRRQLGVCGRQLIQFKHERAIKDDSEILGRYFMKLKVKDEIGVLNHITHAFLEEGLSVESVLQKPSQKDKTAYLILVTHHVAYDAFSRVVEDLLKMEDIIGVETTYRVMDLS